MSLIQTQPRPLPMPRYLTVAEVSAILGISEDTVARQFGSREGVIDIGSPSAMHRRKKRILRISPAALDQFVRDCQVKVRKR